MTTAHRPTYNPTKGGSLQGGNKLYFPSKQYSSKDLPGNLTMKKRNYGQGSRSELKERDFRRELFERERKAKINKNNELLSEMYQNEDINLPLNDTESFNDNRDEASGNRKRRKSFKKLGANDSFLNKEDISNINYDDKSQLGKQKNKNLQHDSANESEENYSKSNSEEYQSDEYAPLNKENKANESDEEGEENEFEQEENESDEQEESEDTDEELMREYEKIRKMREEEKKKQEAENAEKVKKHAEEQLLLGNPLINVSGYSLKKKWFEDTVFKNQSKNDTKTLKRFVNDTVRSDFHRKFLNKSIQ